MSTWNVRFTLHCSIGLALAACSSDSTAIPCTMDDECPSRFCQADDTCAPLQIADASTGGDSSTQMDGPGSNALCTPNNDGTISLSELPLTAGLSANYLIAAGSNISWNTAGSAGSGGEIAWDLSGQLPGDNAQPVMLTAPTGAWWANDFPTATYATILSKSSNLLGVFKVSPGGVTLLGVVSPSAGPGETELSYSPAAQIVAVPFMAGSTWTSTSDVTGLLEGVADPHTEEYDSEVDHVGTMKTPYGTFPVLRVATTLKYNAVAYSLTYAWFAECFGSVAKACGGNCEFGSTTLQEVPTGDFTDPAEVWRITP
jgi:hypothetical protein